MATAPDRSRKIAVWRLPTGQQRIAFEAQNDPAALFHGGDQFRHERVQKPAQLLGAGLPAIARQLRGKPRKA